MYQNMVGPGEVDDDLEAETQGECERFGPVRRCLIYEMKVRNASGLGAVEAAEDVIRIGECLGAGCCVGT